jgi:menaquinone-dependent protoporphyrinogen oxidase
MNIALIYSTTEGQTGKVAEYVRDLLVAEGHGVIFKRAEDAGAADLAGLDAVILAGSVHAGRYQRDLRRFATVEKEILSHMPTLFLSVSLTAAGHDPEGMEELDTIVERFATEIGWEPGQVVHVAGALRMSEYDFFKAWIMRRIAADRGEEIGRDEDREYTDWDILRHAVLGWTRVLDAS